MVACLLQNFWQRLKNLAIGASTIVLYSLVLEPPMTKDVW